MTSPSADFSPYAHPGQERQSVLHRNLRVGYIVVVVLTLLFGVWMGWVTWHRQQQHLRSTLQVEAAFLGDTATAFFQRYEAVMSTLAGDLLRQPEIADRPDTLFDLLRRYRQLLSPNQALAVHLTLPDGQVFASTLVPVNVLADTEHPPDLLNGMTASLNSGGLQIGRALNDPLLQRWAIPLRLVVRDAAGQPRFVVVVPVNLNDFLDKWQRSVVAVQEAMPGAVMGLFNGNGFRLARWPAPKEADLGTFYTQRGAGVLSRALLASQALSGVIAGHSDDDDQSRIGAWVRLARYDAVVGITVPRALLWRDFWNGFWPVIVSLGAWLGLLTLAWQLIRRQFDRESAQLRERADIMYRLANQDSLTGLFNRRGLSEILHRAHEQAVRERVGYALVLFDLDHFKLINDGYGHSAGDVVLQQIAHLLQTQLRQEDRAARWGGEEFLVLLPNTDLDGARLTAEKLRQLIESTRMTVAGVELKLAASFGVSALDAAHPASVPELLGQCDAALYNAKEGGRNRVCVHHEGEAENYLQGHALKQAIEDGRIRPAYQPLVELASGETVGCEALARLVDETGQIVSAAKFIDIADRLRLEHRIDASVSRQVMRRCAARMDEGKPLRKFMINCSADFLSRPEYVDGLLKAARELCHAVGMPDGGSEKPLVIEITERQLIGDAQVVRELVQPLIDFGFQLAVDDFGSGYSSYLYVLKLPVSYLKIEAELVREAAHDARAEAMVRSIHDMAHAIGIKTVAEGIEDQQTLDVMRRIGVDWGQGYLWGPPQLDEEPIPA